MAYQPQYNMNNTTQALPTVVLDSNRASALICQAAQTALDLTADQTAEAVLNSFNDRTKSNDEKNKVFFSFVGNYKAYEKNPQIMNAICESVRMIMYPHAKKPEVVARDIKKNMDDHVGIMQTAWNIQPEEQPGLHLKI